jgi:putative transposase
MYSSRSSATRVLRLRVKDKHAKWLSDLAREVNIVFNYCNELSAKVFERERRFLSGFDFWPYLKGVTRGECALNLPIQAVQEVAEEYARRRRQHGKIRLAWRKSGGARRSLGWIPFKVRTLRYRAGQVIFAGSIPSLGIDLGLQTFAAFSDEALPPIEAERFYRDLEPALARAQRARKRGRVRTIHECALAGVWFEEVDEAFSTQTCSRCDSRAGPKGRKDLGIRGWQCAVCGAIHDRNVNAAHNILAAGHRRLAEGILVP